MKVKINNYLIAALWGFAEATFFFIIPDAYLTRIALIEPLKALKLCILAAVTACIGGTVMYLLAQSYSYQVYNFLTDIPGISEKLVNGVNVAVQTSPLVALFLAPLKGLPYKIFAVTLGAYHINYLYFVLTSFVARLTRFMLTTSVAIFVGKILRKYLSVKMILNVHIILWLIIYCSYFYFIPKA